MTTLILSDLHLGSRASSAAERLDDIARVAQSFDRVIFNGDTLDRCYSDPNADESARFIGAVKSRCGGRHSPPILLSGNHDPAATTEHFVYDETSQTLIFHGDTLADCTHPTKHEEQQIMARLRERWGELGGRPTDFETLHRHYREIQLKWLPIVNPYKKSKTIWQYARSLLYPPRRPLDIVNYWRHAPRLALKVARGFPKPFKRVVFGHSHRCGHWKIDGVELFNTGSFMPFSRPTVIMLDGDALRYMPLDTLVRSRARALPASSDNSKIPVQLQPASADMKK